MGKNDHNTLTDLGGGGADDPKYKYVSFPLDFWGKLCKQ